MPESVSDADLEQILDELRDRHGADLHDHARATLRRRIADRMWRAACPDAASYLARLRQRDDEPPALLSALLVHVTGFERDPRVWRELVGRLLPSLARRTRAEHRRLRAWSAGCADGQEAWTLAAYLLRATGGSFEVHATDLDPAAIAFARAGRYALTELAALPELQLTDGFEVDADAAQVRASLREHVQFSVHDLAGPQLAPASAVVADFDVVMCRNVLIYLQPRIRALVVRRFASMIRPGGVLVLGAAEVLVGDEARWFAEDSGAAGRLCLYRRTEELL